MQDSDYSFSLELLEVPPKIAAIADIHCPRYLVEFKSALEMCDDVDALLLAGDMIDAGRFAEYRQIADSICSRFGEDMPVIACLGNDEYGAEEEVLNTITKDRIEFLEMTTSILTLNDGSSTINTSTTVGIIFTKNGFPSMG
jgi:predicted phosphodiesterase